MKLFVEISISREVIVKCNDNKIRPLKIISNELKTKYNDKYLEKSLSLSSLVFEIELDENNVSDIITEIINNQIKVVTIDEISISVSEKKEDKDSQEKDKESVIQDKDSQEQSKVLAKDDSNNSILSGLKQIKKKIFDNLLDEVDSLIGASDYKELMHELFDIYPLVIENDLLKTFSFQNYLFSINDGCGLSSALLNLGIFIEFTKLYKGNNETTSFYELKLLDKLDNVDYYREVVNDIGKVDTYVMSIDISDVMSKTNMPEFKSFLKEVRKYNRKKVFVFRVPYVEKTVLERISNNINDILYVRDITFVPFDNEDIIKCAKELIERNNFTITDDALDIFSKRIIEEKNDGHFYDVSTVQKVVSEIIYMKLVKNAKEKVNSKEINATDISKLVKGNISDKDISGYELLDQLIGANTIKKQIKEIVSQIKFSKSIKNKDSKDIDKPCIHMQFVGAPGTGKTTIARILGKILKEEGILSLGNFYEYHGTDFKGKYVGHTAPKTFQICRDAYGSILFIDEAYSLYRTGGSADEFGKEAIDTLIAEMEAHRDDMVVIFAGYDQEMEILMSANPGLKSRIPYRIEFPNYSKDDLAKIFMQMVDKNFECSDEFKEKVKEYFDNLPDNIVNSKDFSNGRFVRNLFERTWGKAATRSQLCKLPTINLSIEDFVSACNEKDFNLNVKKQKQIKIGFN